MDNVTLINLIRVVAEKHGCKITNIDFNSQTIYLDGPDEAQISCAVELGEIMEGYDKQNIPGS